MNDRISFDILGNMTTKTSAETVYPEKTVGDALNYSINFSYAEGFAHRLDHAGQRYYAYDADGNVIRERSGEIPSGTGSESGNENGDEWDDWDDWDDDWGDGLGEAWFGFGMGGSGSVSGEGGSGTANSQATVYERIYEWDERDRLTGTTEGTKVVGYVYGEDGKRTNKYSSDGETVYFSNLWSWHDGGNLGTGGQTTKNIYLGKDRIVSKLNRGGGLATYSEEYHKTYYWHSDHLGSAHFITDYQGNEYQRIEYTPYGEEWVELEPDAGDIYLPYRFTGKERDEETGLYYYGARYLDPVYSRWLSTDPAVGDYLPSAPTSDDARKRNQNLPGMGGVFNSINMQLYHYAGNNPIRYIDPDGKFAFAVAAVIVWGVNSVLLGYGVHHYTADKGKDIYRKIDNEGSAKCSSLDMYCLYRSGQLKNITLRQLGLLDKIQNVVEKGILTKKLGDPIQKRFLDQIKKGSYGFNNSYQFEFYKFAIGNATVNGIFNGTVSQNDDGTLHVEGTITYRFTDIFTDPYDTFDFFSGEWNPDGVPYNIHDMWNVDINGDF